MLKLKNFASFNSNLFKGPYLTLPKKFFNKSYDNKIKYNESLEINQILTVTPARNVPENIPRPIYVKIKNYQPSYLEKSFIKSEDLVNFKNACRIAAGAVQRGIDCVKVGMCTDDIDKVVHDYIISQDAYPSAIGYMGFPKSVCTSVNEVACHGIPNMRQLKNGDYVNIDVTAYYGGFHGDTSGMAFVGDVHPDILKLIQITRESMFKAISICKPGEKIRRIAEEIEKHIKPYGYTICREFCGHGVGKELHMKPLVNHETSEYKGREIMEEGMAFTIEPIIMMYPYDELYMWEDNWTIICPDNPSAQWEHTILITKDGHEILTKRDNELVIKF